MVYNEGVPNEEGIMEKKLKKILNEIEDRMEQSLEEDDGCFDGLEIASSIIEKHIKELKKPKTESKKINFWDIKKSIYEKNKENANCIKEFF